ncbi:pyridoxamine 5'-phosphate oxidase family protein [Martelella endophytica]|uniref:Pyridoxamine 5'-phosphate oxidase n=1 Tax=Martelella endophytica TaxID=1486262 RepID=A0A0D5LVQ3_MAREN|nr:pyridoxamine 5'-phosphate oxidase family protein [Martelella endophytica]AJY47448.1 pyridoxamine 5'-phosphate oxidase [Martelella endophytica]
MKTVETVAELKALYGEPGEASLAKVTPALTPAYRRWIEASPFLALATVGPEGLDCSPRGDDGAVVRIADEKTVLLPDWRGNNRVDSLANIVRDPRVALMFMVPGSNNALRINGRAVLAIEPALLESFEMDGRHPRSVIVVTINEVYFQCARAIIRARLWDPERVVDPKALPTAGEMTKQASAAAFDAEAYDREWPERAAKSMW